MKCFQTNSLGTFLKVQKNFLNISGNYLFEVFNNIYSELFLCKHSKVFNNIC